MEKEVKTEAGPATVVVERRGYTWVAIVTEPDGSVVRGSSPDWATLSVHNVRYQEIASAIAELIEELR